MKSFFGSKIFYFIKKLKYKIKPVEPKELQKKREEFYKQFINKDDVVFDVGANLGNRTQPFINVGAKVVAIEPQEACCELLRFKFGNKIQIVSMGLGEKEEIKDFYVSSSHTISSFSIDWMESVKKGRFKNYTWNKPIKVPVTTLDKLICIYGKPKFIKIDVEGFELEVLKGLTHAVEMISFEYTVPEQIERSVDCIIQIEKHNPQIECNYSIGESMDLVLEKWESVPDFKKHLFSQEFIATSFGDIYVRTKKD